MKTLQNNPNIALRFSALAAFVTVLTLFAQLVQAGPVLHGYWTFDDGAITDISGYQAYGTHDGVLVGDGISFNSIYGEPGYNLGNYGNYGNYISFTNDSYAYILNTRISADGENYRNSFDFGGSAFTISAWVKGLPNDSWEPYISKYGESGWGYQLRRREGNTYPTFTYRDGDGSNRDASIDDPVPNIAGANTNLDDGGWHHLVAVYGGNYRDLYMDGQLITHIADTVVDCSGTGEPLVFSGRYAGGYTAFANISLDDVAIYSGALQQSQIEYLSQGGDPTQLPVLTKTYDIALNSPSGSDNISLNRNGNISRHWLDGDISFDGSSFIRTDLRVGTAGFNGSFTASAWVYLNSTSGDQAIFGNNTESANAGLHLIVRDSHPHMGFYSNDLQAADVTLNTGEWYYLTYQYDEASQTQSIYLNGNQIATQTGAAAFAGTNVLDIGKIFNGNSRYLNGKLKGISITDAVLTADEIRYQMNNPDTRRIENFEWGRNADEWYSGGGASLGNLYEYNNARGRYKVLSMYAAPATDAEKTIYEQGNNDNTTGIIWGPQFTVSADASADAVFSADVVGGDMALNVADRQGGGVGVALWDMTTGDYVRDDYNNVAYGNGYGTDQPKHVDISLNGRQGHDLMVVVIDRQTDSWGWIGPENITVDGTQVSALAGAAQHHLILNDFNFDTAGEFSGMYEVDAEGNRLDSVTNFTNGNRGNGAVTNYYVDSSGTFDNGNKGFLSSGSVNGGEESSVGVLRSDPFLIQGDVMEYYIAGGNNIANKHLDVVDAETGEVYLSATGNDTNDFRYDFWSLKDLQGKAVYLRVVDTDNGSSWSHLELDQIRQVKFAPTAAEVAASNNTLKSADLSFKTDQPGFNAESYSLANNGIYSLDDLASCITGGVGPDDKYYQETIDNFTTGSGYGVDLFSTLNVGAIGQYTLAVTNDEAYRITLNGDTVYESDGSGNMEFIPLTFSETGPYALKMLYLDNSGEGVSLYMATGAFDSWNDDFALLAGAGAGFVNSYAAYLNGGGEGGSGVPEPSTWALLILGAAGLLFWRKKSK